MAESVPVDVSMVSGTAQPRISNSVPAPDLAVKLEQLLAAFSQRKVLVTHWEAVTSKWLTCLETCWEGRAWGHSQGPMLWDPEPTFPITDSDSKQVSPLGQVAGHHCRDSDCPQGFCEPDRAPLALLSWASSLERGAGLALVLSVTGNTLCAWASAVISFDTTSHCDPWPSAMLQTSQIWLRVTLWLYPWITLRVIL